MLANVMAVFVFCAYAFVIGILAYHYGYYEGKSKVLDTQADDLKFQIDDLKEQIEAEYGKGSGRVTDEEKEEGEEAEEGVEI